MSVYSVPLDSDFEHLDITVTQPGRRFLVILRGKSDRIQDSFRFKREGISQTGASQGLCEIPYDGPIVPSSVLQTAFEDQNGRHGWLLGFHTEDDFDAVFGNRDVRYFFRGTAAIHIKVLYSSSSVRLFRVLQLCTDCTGLTIDVIRSHLQHDIPSEQVSLYNVKRLTILHDERSKKDQAGHYAFFQQFKSLEGLQGLCLVNTPLTAQSVKSLCPQGLQELSISNYTKPELELIFLELEAKDIRLGFFLPRAVHIPSGFRSPALSNLNFLYLTEMSVKSVGNILAACPDITQLYFNTIKSGMFERSKLISAIVSNCTHLEALGVFGCKWMDYAWLQKLSKKWKARRLKEFKFDEMCALKLQSFPCQYNLSGDERMLTEKVCMLPKMTYSHSSGESIWELEGDVEVDPDLTLNVAFNRKFQNEEDSGGDFYDLLAGAPPAYSR